METKGKMMKLFNKSIILFLAIGLNAAPVLAAEPTMIDQGGYHADFKTLIHAE